MLGACGYNKANCSHQDPSRQMHRGLISNMAGFIQAIASANKGFPVSHQLSHERQEINLHLTSVDGSNGTGFSPVRGSRYSETSAPVHCKDAI